MFIKGHRCTKSANRFFYRPFITTQVSCKQYTMLLAPLMHWGDKLIEEQIQNQSPVIKSHLFTSLNILHQFW